MRRRQPVKVRQLPLPGMSIYGDAMETVWRNRGYLSEGYIGRYGIDSRVKLDAIGKKAAEQPPLKGLRE